MSRIDKDKKLFWLTIALIVVAGAQFLVSSAALAQDGQEPPPGGLLLVTEENPPYNMTESATGELTGTAADLFRAALDRAQVPYRWAMLPWPRAFRTAQNVPNVCAFAATITAERRPQFRWIGPLAEGGFALFDLARTDGTPMPPIPETLVGRTVLVQAGGVETDHFKKLGMQQIPTALENMMQMLQAGRADFIGRGIHTGPWAAKRAGVSLRLVKQLDRTELGAACNSDSDPAILARVQAALDSLYQDGTAAAITGRYW